MTHLLRRLWPCLIVLALPACLLAPGGDAGGRGSGCDPYGNCTEGGSVCESLSDPTSCDNAGCLWGNYCAGFATPCYELGIDTCDQQAGCSWDGYTGTCGGTEGDCSAFVGTACVYQMGCEDAYGCVDG